MTKETGGPASGWAASDAHQHGMHKPQEGMTLRDYFAARAMQGLMSGGTGGWALELLAETAYEMADAMMKARSNT